MKEKAQAIAAYEKELAEAVALVKASNRPDLQGNLSDSVDEATVRAALAAPRKGGNRVRRIVELCADQDSSIRSSQFTKGCSVVRITEEDDLLSTKGFRKAQAAACDKEIDDVLFALALPCTGGSNFQRINEMKSEESRTRVKKLKQKFFHLLQMADALIDEAKEKKPGCVSVLFELPQGNSYWE